jgi:hypothetical protein
VKSSIYLSIRKGYASRTNNIASEWIDHYETVRKNVFELGEFSELQIGSLYLSAARTKQFLWNRQCNIDICILSETKKMARKIMLQDFLLIYSGKK